MNSDRDIRVLFRARGLREAAARSTRVNNLVADAIARDNRDLTADEAQELRDAFADVRAAERELVAAAMTETPSEKARHIPARQDGR